MYEQVILGPRFPEGFYCFGDTWNVGDTDIIDILFEP
jgi:hypothetical protein